MTGETRQKQRIRVVHERDPSDNYITPPEIARWAVDKCLQISERYCGNISRKDMKMLEPGCGDEAPFATYAASLGIDAFGTDSRPIVEVKRPPGVHIFGQESYLRDEDCPRAWGEKFDIIATNPPFKYGIEFITTSLGMLTPRGVACFLMKVNFLGTQGRGAFFSKRPPSEVHILTKRPSFAHGGTDRMQEYALTMWNGVEVDKKIRAKYGRICRVYWEMNKEWEVGDGAR